MAKKKQSQKKSQKQAETRDFKVGDQVVYPHHGVATIEKIEEKDVLGEKKRYLVLRLDTGDLTLMVPAENVEDVGIRDTIEKDQVDKVLKILKKGEITDQAENWSRRYKANQERIRSGDVQQVAEVVRNLSLREREKGLSTGEKRMLNKAREILLGELAVALSMETDEAEEVLEKALG